MKIKVSSSTPSVSGVSMPDPVAEILNEKYGPAGSDLKTVFDDLVDVEPWAVLWLTLHFLSTGTVVSLAEELAEMDIPFVDPKMRVIAKAAAAQARKSMEMIATKQAQIDELVDAIGVLTAEYDDAALDDQFVICSDILAANLKKRIAESELAIHTETAHDLAIWAAIHGSIDHARELYHIGNRIATFLEFTWWH